MFEISKPWFLEGPPISDSALPRGWLWERRAVAPLEVQRRVIDQGLVLADLNKDQAAIFIRAEELISCSPSLALVVASLVGELHVLSAKAGFDVSHSEPCWNSRIFVSLPDRSDDIGALRLAESVVHEAMHLNLTQFETRRPIALCSGGAMVSPWRAEPRPFLGVAHGLFVFACLHAYFCDLLRLDLVSIRNHINGRISDIRSEIASIDLCELKSGLTPVGQSLASSWRALVMAGG